jgi:hypothetical protein
VRFLDVHHAITALAQTAGEQFTRNLKRWSPADARACVVLTHV